jgi:HSP20 family protein
MNPETDTLTQPSPDVLTRQPGESARGETRPASPEWHAERTEHGLSLQVNLPGVDKNDVEISFADGQLRLRATRQPSPTGGELIYGDPAPEHYELRLRVGRSLNVKGSEAKLELGVLHLDIPLADEAKPQTIAIR